MYSLCLDCGATNVRAMVVNEQGVIVGKAAQPNATLPGEENPEFHIWDADRIFKQLSECAVKALEGLDVKQVVVATVTTFGVDGALVDDAGSLLCPVIS
ncbi:FGGY family carbohydrate kinase, partial [uncultured Akkermansia sp.]